MAKNKPSFWHSKQFGFMMLVMPGVLYLLFFFVLPLIIMIVISFWRTESYTIIRDWNIDNYVVLLTKHTYLVFLGRSLLMSVAVTLVSLIYSWPVAYFIAYAGGRYKIILVLLISAPFFTGIILRITALQQIFGPIGIINTGLMNIGLPPINAFMYSNFASAMGLIYLWIPFMVLAIYLSLLNFNFDLLEVAKVNGASPINAFFEITLPLNWIGTAVGIILVFVPTMASAITPKFLGGVNGALFGNILSHQFGATGTWALGSAMGVVLFFVSVIMILLVWKTVNLRRSGFTGEEL